MMTPSPEPTRTRRSRVTRDDYVDAGSDDDLVWTGYEADTVAANPGDDQIYLGYGDHLYGAL